MANIDKSIFKQYDIRGVFNESLHVETAHLIGRGFATYLKKKNIHRVITGHDNRLSSEILYQALISGLLESGCEVVDIGLTVTPVIDFSWYELKAPATIMLTASHSPARYNGFKMAVDKNLIYGDELQKIYQLIKRGKFIKGKGIRKFSPINVNYYRYILRTIKLKKQLKIVLDCGNGTGSVLAPQIFHDIGCSQMLYHTISDGSFPNHDPYPQKIEGYKDHFIKELKTGKYDLGVALDGDCDRMGIFDEKGNFIENDKIIYLHAREILKDHKGATFVVNVAVSQGIIDRIKELGGKVVIWKTGPPHMLPKMRETGAILGGEISGHLAFADRYFGYDDGIYTAARTLELLSWGRKKISEYFSDLPKYYSTPEFRVFAGENKKFEVIDNIYLRLKQDETYEIINVDGLRVKTKDGWFLIRSSQTEPLVTGRIEGKTKKSMESLKRLVQDLLKAESVKLDWRNPIAKH